VLRKELSYDQDARLKKCAIASLSVAKFFGYR